MTPQDQEFTHKPEIGQSGDCQRAVIATLLDLPISQVPNFAGIAKQDPIIFWESLQEFCASHGYAYLSVPAQSGHSFFGADDGPYHVISGPSPRASHVTHAVVGRDGRIVFDPHLSRSGLGGTRSSWTYGFLVRNVPEAKQGGASND